MNKSNTKAKLTLVPSPKKKKVPSPGLSQGKGSQDAPQTIEQLATVEFWKAEIAGLKAGSYKSVGEATENLIDQVLERLKLKQNGEDDVKEFLRLVFESSEILQSTIKKALKL